MAMIIPTFASQLKDTNDSIAQALAMLKILSPHIDCPTCAKIVPRLITNLEAATLLDSDILNDLDRLFLHIQHPTHEGGNQQ